jgi:hypothetical protein
LRTHIFRTSVAARDLTPRAYLSVYEHLILYFPGHIKPQGPTTIWREKHLQTAASSKPQSANHSMRTSMSSKQDESQAVNPRARRCSNRAANHPSFPLGGSAVSLCYYRPACLQPWPLKDEVDNQRSPTHAILRQSIVRAHRFCGANVDCQPPLNSR